MTNDTTQPTLSIDQQWEARARIAEGQANNYMDAWRKEHVMNLRLVDALRRTRAAIESAIYSEDGLDGYDGEIVLEYIRQTIDLDSTESETMRDEYEAELTTLQQENARLAAEVERLQEDKAMLQARIWELDAELAALRAEPRWEPVPQSLEYDLITHAIRHGEIPTDYCVCRLVPGQDTQPGDGQE